MKFNVYNSKLEVIATYNAADIDAATDKCIEEDSCHTQPDIDCISDHITLVMYYDEQVVYAVCEEGYTPDAEDFVIGDL